MRTSKIFLATATITSGIATAHAQLPNADLQVDSLNQRRQIEQSAQSLGDTNVPALYESETSDVGPQSVLQMKMRRTWVEAFGDAQYFYTDNMFLATHNKEGSDVFVGTVQAAIAPTPYEFQGGELAPRIGYQHQWFNYGLITPDSVITYTKQSPFAGGNSPLDTFDFNVSTPFADISWQRDNWTFTAGFDYRRLLTSDSYYDFYHEYVPRWCIKRDFQLTPNKAISIGYEGDYRVTETAPPVPLGYGTDFNDRTDQGLFIVGSWRLCSHAILQPYYRFEYSHYTRIDRDDFLHSFGLALHCPITKNVALRTFFSYDNFKSNGFFAQDYQKLDAGGGLNLIVRF